MKTTKITLVLLLFFAVGNIATADAQSWLERLGKRAEESAKRKVERKVEEKVDKAVDKAFDKTEETISKQRKTRKTVNENMEVIEEPEEPEEEISDDDFPEQTTLMQGSGDWDTGEPFHALNKGTQIQYTVYNGKGKVEGYQNQTVVEFTRKGREVNAVISGTFTDRKGKEQNAATVSLRFSKGNFYVDLLDILPPKGLQNMDLEAKVSGNDMMIPEKLTSGQKLPDAQATFRMKMKGGGDSVDLPPITYRVFNRKAVGAESVETPVGKFVCFKIAQSAEVDLPLIGKQVFHSATWIGKGIGTVKTESYDSKGKLQSRTLLTGLQ